MFKKLLYWLKWGTLLIFAALGLTMLLLAPDSLGPFGVTLWFIGLLLGISGALLTLQNWWRPVATSAQLKAHLRRSLLAAVVLTAVLALSSLRQLGLRDIILIILIAAAVNFYLKRTIMGEQ